MVQMKKGDLVSINLIIMVLIVLIVAILSIVYMIKTEKGAKGMLIGIDTLREDFINRTFMNRTHIEDVQIMAIVDKKIAQSSFSIKKDQSVFIDGQIQCEQFLGKSIAMRFYENQGSVHLAFLDLERAQQFADNYKNREYILAVAKLSDQEIRKNSNISKEVLFAIDIVQVNFEENHAWNDWWADTIATFEPLCANPLYTTPKIKISFSESNGKNITSIDKVSEAFKPIQDKNQSEINFINKLNNIFSNSSNLNSYRELVNLTQGNNFMVSEPDDLGITIFYRETDGNYRSYAYISKYRFATK